MKIVFIIQSNTPAVKTHNSWEYSNHITYNCQFPNNNNINDSNKTRNIETNNKLMHND